MLRAPTPSEGGAPQHDVLCPGDVVWLPVNRGFQCRCHGAWGNAQQAVCVACRRRARGDGGACARGGWVGRGDIWCFFCGCQPCGPASSRRRHGPEAKWHEGVVHLATASACSGLHVQTPTCVSPPHARAGTHSTHTADTSGGGGWDLSLCGKGMVPRGLPVAVTDSGWSPAPPRRPPFVCSRSPVQTPREEVVAWAPPAAAPRFAWQMLVAQHPHRSLVS